jgi:hypothetical protein
MLPVRRVSKPVTQQCVPIQQGSGNFFTYYSKIYLFTPTLPPSFEREKIIDYLNSKGWVRFCIDVFSDDVTKQCCQKKNFCSNKERAFYIISLCLLSPHYPQEFHFYPIWGNLPRFADHCLRRSASQEFKSLPLMQPVFTTDSWIQLLYSHVRYLRPSLISCHPRLGHSGGVFHSVVCTKIPYAFLISTFVG